MRPLLRIILYKNVYNLSYFTEKMETMLPQLFVSTKPDEHSQFYYLLGSSLLLWGLRELLNTESFTSYEGCRLTPYRFLRLLFSLPTLHTFDSFQVETSSHIRRGYLLQLFSLFYFYLLSI